MVKRLGTSAVLCLFASVSNAQAASLSDFKGSWTVTNVVGYGSTSGGIPEAKKLLGKVLRISAGVIEFDADRCKPHQGFKVSVVDTTSRLKHDFDIDIGDTGLPVRTALLDSSNCTVIYRMDGHRVLFGWDGVVLRAIRP